MANVDIQRMLERHTARRTFPLLARTKVCRNLFGAVDHEQLNCEMKRKLQEISERDQSRWNFNFEENVPLPGNYEWQELEVSAVPPFYSGTARTGNVKDAESSADCGRTNDALAQGAGQVPRTGPLDARKHTSPPVCGTRQTSPAPESLRNSTTRITDFFPRRKRTSDLNQPERTPLSSSPISADVSPSKRIK